MQSNPRLSGAMLWRLAGPGLHAVKWPRRPAYGPRPRGARARYAPVTPYLASCVSSPLK